MMVQSDIIGNVQYLW